MTEQDDTRREWDNVHALSGAYAVDAVDDVERARFEEHLLRCPECRAEVASLRETAAALATEPVDPPAGLRESVLAGIESIRPLPPLTSQYAGSAPVGSGRRPERPRRRWVPTAPLLVAAALVLVALATAVWVRPWSGEDRPAATTATERVLADPHAATFEQRLPGGAHAKVVVSRSEGRAVVLTEGLAPAPKGKVYELWLQTPKGVMEPAGLMPDQSDATVLLDGDASRATGVGITIEPDGGSPQPHLPPVAFFDLTTT